MTLPMFVPYSLLQMVAHVRHNFSALVIQPVIWRLQELFSAGTYECRVSGEEDMLFYIIDITFFLIIHSFF